MQDIDDETRALMREIFGPGDDEEEDGNKEDDLPLEPEPPQIPSQDQYVFI